jgi:hypothetical protein
MFPKSANAPPESIRAANAEPSRATPLWQPEGVETGREPPDRAALYPGVVAKAKAQSRPRTLPRFLDGRKSCGGGESRSGMGSGESWFEPRRGNSELRNNECCGALLLFDIRCSTNSQLWPRVGRPIMARVMTTVGLCGRRRSPIRRRFPKRSRQSMRFQPGPLDRITRRPCHPAWIDRGLICLRRSSA